MLFADAQFAVSTSAATTDAHNIAERFIIPSLAFTPSDCSPCGASPTNSCAPGSPPQFKLTHYRLLTEEQNKNYVPCSFKPEGHCHGPRRYRRGSRFSVTHPVPGHGGRLGRGARGPVSGPEFRLSGAAGGKSFLCGGHRRNGQRRLPSPIFDPPGIADGEHHGCREIGWRKNGWRKNG